MARTLAVAILTRSIAAGVLIAVAAAAGAADARRIEQVPAAVRPVRAGARWALVVGVNRYETPEIAPLRGAVADAQAMSRVLVERAGFARSQVFTLTSDGPARPRAETLLQILGEIRQAAGPDDLFLFFFAGHGVEVEGQRFLLTEEARISSAAALKVSGLSVNLLMQEIENLPVAHRIVLVDACRDDPSTRAGRVGASETFATAFILKPGAPRGVRATFLSCMTGQSAYEWSEKGRGFFSYFIEKGLEGEAAQFGKVTLSSLDVYLNEMVPRAVREQRGKEQTPFVDRSGETLVLVEGSRLVVPVADAPAVRRVYGVVKDSGGRPIDGAPVSVEWPGPMARRADLRSDEDGFFTVEVPVDAVATVTAALPGFVERTTVSRPDEGGEKLRLFLVATAAEAPAVKSAAATPPPPAPIPEATATPAETTSAPTAGSGPDLVRAAYQAFLVEDFEQAESVARSALERDDGNAVAIGILASAVAVDGVNQRRPERLAEADAAAGRALRLVPSLAIARNAKGLVAWGRGDLEAAIGEFELAARLDPRLGAASTNLAFMLFQKRRYKAAERAYRDAIRLTPEAAVPYNGLAQVLLELDRANDAAKAARAAIARYERRDRYLGLFYVNLAVALHRQGKAAEAVEAVGRAKGLGVQDNPAYPIIEAGR